MLGVGRVKIYELIKSGVLPALNIGGLKVRKETLEQFLEKYEGYDLSECTNIKKVD